MPNTWIIRPGDVSGGSTGSKLNGLRITAIDNNTAYGLMKGDTLYSACTNNGSLPTPKFEFKDFGYEGNTWTLTVDTLTGGPSGNQAEGKWRNNAPNPILAEEGTFTAQAGGGVDVDSKGKGTGAASA